jgi:peptidoglycan/LPS O-acetylase OafA/YrhL
MASRIILVTMGAAHITPEILTPCRVDALVSGALAALLVRGENLDLARKTRVGAGLLELGVLLIALYRRSWSAYDPLVQTIGYTVMDLCFAAILILSVATRQPTGLARLFSHRVLRWFGLYSYAMYVFHVPLMPWFDRAFPVSDLTRRLGSPYAGLVAHTLIAIALTAVCALASWHLYEKHFLKLKSRFSPAHAPAPADTLPLPRVPKGVL